MPDVLIKVCSAGNGGHVGTVRKRRHFISEISSCNNGACYCRKRSAHAGSHAHKSCAYSSGSAPGGSCADRKNHCHKERGYNDKFWINDLKSDINQERDSSADDPRADHQSYSDQDHDSRKSLCQLIYNFIFHILPGIPQKET